MPAMKQSTPPNPFGTTENKSAASLVTEAKSAPASADPEEPDMAAAAPLSPPDDAPITDDQIANDETPDPVSADVEVPAEEPKIAIVLNHHLNIIGPAGKVVAKVPGDTIELPATLARAFANGPIAEFADETD